MRVAKTASKSTDCVARGQAHADRRASSPAGDLEHVVGGALGARRRAQRRAVDHVVVDRGLGAGLVLAEQERARRPRSATRRARRARDDGLAVGVSDGLVASPPQDHVLRNHSVGSRCSVRGVRPAVVRGDAHQDVVVRGLRVLDDHVEVAVLVEDPGVEQLVLEVLLAAAAVLVDQVAVRERALRVLVQALQVRVRRRGVQVEPVLLGVLAVVALAVGEPEHALLEDRVGAVPQREREAHPLAVVADAGQPVLAPAVGARTGLVVREVVPRVAV